MESNKSSVKISLLAEGMPTSYVTYPTPETKIRGNPKQISRDYFMADNKDTFVVGHWRCEPGSWRLIYPPGKFEFCHILSGTAHITDENGYMITVKKGDKFIIPAGFKGIWDTIYTIEKYYVIHCS